LENFYPLPDSDAFIFLLYQLPGFDALETEDRIQKTGNRSASKTRRQKRVVGFAVATPQRQASEPGSW
jgi:hypothetical protein